MSKEHGRVKSFKFAFDGLKTCISGEPNFKIHLVIALAVSIVAYYLSFTPLEWAILVLTISSVLILEILNTSMEAFLDIISPEKGPQVKKAKDTAAAAVLIASIAAVFVGAFLFLPKLI